MTTLPDRLTALHKKQPSRDGLLEDGMRILDAAEVAYLLGLHSYRSVYREGIPKTRHGWLAQDVKAHILNGRIMPATHTQPAPNFGAARSLARERTSRGDAPLWGRGS